MSDTDENHLIGERRAKLAKMRERGTAFPNDFRRNALAADLLTAYGGKTPEALDAEARELAGEMLRTTPLGLRLTKEALNHAIDAQGLEAAIAMEDRNQILCVQGEDFGEGVRAFLEKRPPDYSKGRADSK